MGVSGFRVLPLAVFLCVAAGGIAMAADSAPDGISACTISAWSTDKDPAGLNVRGGPGAGHPVIGRLPPPIEPTPDYVFASEATITGSQDGWFRITRAIQDDYISDAEPKTVFEGEGWVSGRKLGLLLNDTRLYSAPDAEAPLVAKLLAETADGAVGPDAFVVDRLHACQGYWVEVSGTFLGKQLHGWVRGTCANQVTTCP